MVSRIVLVLFFAPIYLYASTDISNNTLHENNEYITSNNDTIKFIQELETRISKQNNEIETLRLELLQVKTDAEELTKENLSFSNKLTETSNTEKICQQNLAKYKSETQQLIAESENKTRQINEQQALITNFQDEIAALRQENNGLKIQISTQESRILQLSENETLLQQALRESDNTLLITKKQLDELTQETVKKQTELSTLYNEIANLEQKTTLLKDEIQSQSKEIQQLTEKTESGTKTNNELQNELTSTLASLKQNTIDLINLKQELNTIENDFHILNAELKTLNQEKADLEKLLNEKNQTEQQLQNKLKQLESDNDNLKSKIIQLEQENSKEQNQKK